LRSAESIAFDLVLSTLIVKKLRFKVKSDFVLKDKKSKKERMKKEGMRKR
jgi:hypothetical protein